MLDRSLRQQTIGMVDDDSRVLEALDSLLRSAGHTVRLFESAEAALMPHALDDVHCLISDIGLPGMSGYRLKMLIGCLLRPLPVILITGHAVGPDVAAAEAGTCENVSRKPFSGLQLLAAVETALDEGRKATKGGQG